MAKPIVYKKDTKYNVSYINKNGETKNIEYTPEEDLSIAKIITNIKEENSDYLKLVSIEESKSIKKESLLKEDKMMYKTYADIVNDGRAADVADKTYDMLVYMDYDPDSDDYFDMFMAEFCKQLNIVDESQLESGIVVCDVTTAIRNHYKIFDDIFELNGEDEEENVGDIVSEMIPDIVSGYTTDKVYEQLYYGFIDAPVPYTGQPEVKPENIEDHSVSEEDKKEESKLQEEFDPALDLRVKPKFKERFPEEGSFIDQIPEDLTFRKVMDALNNEEDIYDVIGVNDSVVREEIFILISDLLDVEYDEIYQLWLHGPKKDKANENFTMKKEDINEEDTFEELIPEEIENEVNEEETAEPEEVESDTELEGSGEDQTQTQLDVEEAVEEVENPTEEDKLATEVANSSLDVLIADEKSAIEGYNGFLTQAKDTLLPPLYEVLEKEINEIIKDEEDHINKLNTIKSAFHIEDMPLDESIELDKGKTPSKDIKLKEIIKNATRQAKIDGYDQYIYKDSDGEYSFTRVEDENRKPIGKIEYEPKPHTVGTTKYIQLESKEIKTEVFDRGNTIFELKLDCSNEDTFDVGEMLSKNVAKELRKVADKLDDTIDQGPIMDINGNKVGSYGFGYEGVMSSLDESKEVKTESVEDKNLANIKACLNQSGIRNPHTVERMAKDVLAILNTYDEDTKDEDGLYYIPAITYAIQDKVERITGKRPELTIESKEIKTENNIPEHVLETARNLFNEINKLDDMHSKTTDIEQGKKYVDKIQELTNRLDQIETQYHFGFLDNGEIKLNEVKTESVTDTEFEDIDSLQDLQEVIENLYEQEKIDDDIYDEVSDYISTRIDEVEKYIEERSKVTNTDEKDIIGIMEDNTLDAIERVKEIINGKKSVKEESKEITLDDVLNELGIMKDSPAAEEESFKIKEFMETHPEASLDQIVKAYKNYEETGLFESKKESTLLNEDISNVQTILKYCEDKDYDMEDILSEIENYSNDIDFSAFCLDLLLEYSTAEESEAYEEKYNDDSNFDDNGNMRRTPSIDEVVSQMQSYLSSNGDPSEGNEIILNKINMYDSDVLDKWIIDLKKIN